MELSKRKLEIILMTILTYLKHTTLSKDEQKEVSSLGTEITKELLSKE